MFFSPSAYVHPYEVCRRPRRSRAATVVRSCVVDASQKAKIAEKVHKPTLTVNAINFELNGFNFSIWVSWSPSESKSYNSMIKVFKVRRFQ